ncbi:MAG: hypothetical protein HY720_31855 [Planctomycetes bacterium]|nr:hypothetical protein [Planctomycetota bacterium]
MSFFKSLFRRAVALPELRVALRQVERSRARKLAELRRHAARQQIAIEKMKDARKDGNSIEVDYLWEELKVLRCDLAFARRELRVANLEGIALLRYVRGLERLEKNGDRERAKKLFERIRASDLDAKLAASEVREDEYLAELDRVFESVGLEVARIESEAADPEKDVFLAEIDALVAAEEAGDREQALEHEGSARALVDPSD